TLHKSVHARWFLSERRWPLGIAKHESVAAIVVKLPVRSVLFFQIRHSGQVHERFPQLDYDRKIVEPEPFELGWFHKLDARLTSSRMSRAHGHGQKPRAEFNRTYFLRFIWRRPVDHPHLAHR